MVEKPHVLNLTVRRIGGHDARVVEGHFLPDGSLAVRGLEDISDTNLGRRILASPEYQMAPAITRIFLGPHPRAGMPDPDGVIADGEARGVAWLLVEHEGVRVLMPITREELRAFEC